MSNTPIVNIFTPLFEGDDLQLSNLFNSLILFEKVIIDSRRLSEIKTLADLFGSKNVIKLIKSDKVDINGGMITTGTELKKTVGNDYLFTVLPMQFDPKSTKAKDIQNLKSQIGKTDGQWKKLLVSVLSVYRDYSDESFNDYTNRVLGFIEEDNMVRDALLKKLFKTYFESDASNRVKIVREDKNLFRFNFSSSADSKKQESMLESCSTNLILGMNRIVRNNFNEMYFNSMIGYQNRELEYQNYNSSYIHQKFDPKKQFERHEKVLSINGLPAIKESEVKNIEFKNFLKAINSDEVIEFRSWLWNIDNLEGDELTERVNNFTKTVDKFLRVPILKKSFDFLQSLLVSGTTGDTSGVLGEVSGSIIDKYIFNKLRRKDHFTFINDIYPSIFKK
ncbi:MAG: hypothetical protein WD035_04550 [Balneolaceae bacterium]